jgi:hypothetical protein
MPAITDNWYIEKGATFYANYVIGSGTAEVFTATDLTGMTARGQIRKSAGSADILYDFTADITLGTTGGEVDIEIAASVTETLEGEDAVMDIELVNGPVVRRIVEGEVELSPEVTRP